MKKPRPGMSQRVLPAVRAHVLESRPAHLLHKLEPRFRTGWTTKPPCVEDKNHPRTSSNSVKSLGCQPLCKSCLAAGPPGFGVQDNATLWDVPSSAILLLC